MDVVTEEIYKNDAIMISSIKRLLKGESYKSIGTTIHQVYFFSGREVRELLLKFYAEKCRKFIAEELHSLHDGLWVNNKGQYMSDLNEMKRSYRKGLILKAMRRYEEAKTKKETHTMNTVSRDYVEYGKDKNFPVLQSVCAIKTPDGELFPDRRKALVHLAKKKEEELSIKLYGHPKLNFTGKLGKDTLYKWAKEYVHLVDMEKEETIRTIIK